MITAVCAFLGAMVGGMFINYVLHPSQNDHDELYRNSGHHGSND